ncbi:MAG: zinc ribbon domain-containing protein [Chloroflexi bacterium]|nr:zinc ribbon domain-containing protein [Chloroflexota bacterium]
MPVYTYRREDGTTFDIRQSFLEEPLTVDPVTGQKVQRVVHPAGIIFKGSGFYVNDSKNASRSSVNNTANGHKDKTETKTDSKPAVTQAAAD